MDNARGRKAGIGDVQKVRLASGQHDREIKKRGGCHSWSTLPNQIEKRRV